MMLPAILYQKVYSIPTPTMGEFSKIINKSQLKEEFPDQKTDQKIDVSYAESENFLNLVNKKLAHLAQGSNKSCSSYYVYNSLRNDSSVEFKHIQLKQVKISFLY